MQTSAELPTSCVVASMEKEEVILDTFLHDRSRHQKSKVKTRLSQGASKKKSSALYCMDTGCLCINLKKKLFHKRFSEKKSELLNN